MSRNHTKRSTASRILCVRRACDAFIADLERRGHSIGAFGDVSRVRNIQRALQKVKYREDLVAQGKSEAEANRLADKRFPPFQKARTIKQQIAESTGQKTARNLRAKKGAKSQKQLIRERWQARVQQENAIQKVKDALQRQVERLQSKQAPASQIRNEIVSLIHAQLPMPMRGRYLKAVARAKIARDLTNAIDRIARDMDRVARAEFIKLVRLAQKQGGISKTDAHTIISMIYDGVSYEAIGQALQKDRLDRQAQEEPLTPEDPVIMRTLHPLMATWRIVFIAAWTLLVLASLLYVPMYEYSQGRHGRYDYSTRPIGYHCLLRKPFPEHPRDEIRIDMERLRVQVAAALAAGIVPMAGWWMIAKVQRDT